MTRDEIIVELKKESRSVWYDEKYCLEAVKRNGYALQYVPREAFGIFVEKKEDRNAHT